MNHSKNPRTGATRRISERLRYPAGYGKRSGRFVRADDLKSFLEEVAARAREAKRQEKLKHDRETRAATRARRSELLAKPDGVQVSAGELRERLEGWGSTATGPLREKTRYKWHGVFHLQGGAAVMEQALKLAGSDVKIKKLSGGPDAQYEMLLTPFYGKYTPSIAEARLPGHEASMLAQLQRTGARVVSLGAFWRK